MVPDYLEDLTSSFGMQRNTPASLSRSKALVILYKKIKK